MSKTYTYIVRELQNADSFREGTEIKAADLTAPKRAASRGQMYQGTYLRIETCDGCLLATKESGGRWIDRHGLISA